MLTESEISNELYRFVKEGKESRQTGTPSKYAGNTVAHMLGCVGWVQEDLRLALMRKDEDYCHGQALMEARQ